MENTAAFLELVQLHERIWGTEAYPGRPTLAQVLDAPIVVLWVDTPSKQDRTTSRDKYFKFGIYQDSKQLSEALMGVLVAGKVTNTPCRKISKVYYQQKPIAITGIRLLTDKKE